MWLAWQVQNICFYCFYSFLKLFTVFLQFFTVFYCFLKVFHLFCMKTYVFLWFSYVSQWNLWFAYGFHRFRWEIIALLVGCIGFATKSVVSLEFVFVSHFSTLKASSPGELDAWVLFRQSCTYENLRITQTEGYIHSYVSRCIGYE